MPAKLRRLLRLATLGRSQGPEKIYQTNTTLATPTTIVVNNGPIPLGRPLESFLIVISMRVDITVAPYTAGVPEAPQTILENVQIQGTHAKWGNQTPVNLSGASLFAYERNFQSFGNDLLIGTTRSLDPSMPFVQTAGLTAGALGSYDVRVCYEIPTGLMFGSSPSAKAANLPYYWRPEDWGQSLQMTLRLGDKTSFGTPAAGTVVTFSGFGGTSTPLVEVFAVSSLMGAYATEPNAGLVIRNEYNVAPYLTGVTTAVQFGQLLQKQITSNILVKTGRALANTTSGVNVFSSLSDTQLDVTQVKLDNKYLRNLGRNYATKNFYGRMFNTVGPQGYLLVSFVDGGNPALALRADRFAPGAQFALFTDVNEADATNRQTIIQEQIFGGPFLRGRGVPTSA